MFGEDFIQASFDVRRQSRRMSFRTMIAAGLAVAAMNGAATAADRWAAREVAALRLEPCQAPGSTEMLECGVYRAPEDRSVAGGRTIPLKVVVAKARKPLPGRYPIFYFDGGPGSAATRNAGFIATAPEREHHDYVLIDQRGTGEGHRLACPGPGTDAEMGSWLESVYQAPYPARCSAKFAKVADLRLYTTPIAMQDYDEIRRALGYKKINLYGGSYGARSAMVYLKMFGHSANAAMIGAHVPFEAKLPLYHPKGAQAALDRVFAECRADAACHAAFPSPSRDYHAALARLRASPVTVEFKHPQTGQPVTARLTAARFANTIRAMLYSLGTQRQLPLAFSNAASGDFSMFATAAIFARGANMQLAAGMALSATCAEDVARITRQETSRETAGTFLGRRFVEERKEACAKWPKGVLPPDLFTPFTRDTPMLLITGTHDPVTPKWMTEAYARRFPNSRTFTVPAGHSLPEGRCLTEIMLQLFATADPNKVDLGCTREMTLPPFALPR
jgi:pimeloyl-ACP methyl ester carboxylesterase